MSRHTFLGALLLLQLLSPSISTSRSPPSLPAAISKFLQNEDGPTGDEGKKWALLVAGSRGYENYRHQADVCHAFQILKKGGLPEENIIVFMYDDIAFDENNPRPGVIVNSPTGGDVYKGVPKDYTGENANVQNFFAVILANTSGLTGGSGKVLNSGPKDRIFIFYTDHGSSGLVGMAADDVVYADDLINVLKKKHDANSYASMVFYLEACESGSMFEGLLPKSLNIYAVTASNATENSFATYCPDFNNVSVTYDVCLGDRFSVSWMEDSDEHDMRSETLAQQLQVVKQRTLPGDSEDDPGSHVMEYGNLMQSGELLYNYMGAANSYNTRNKQGATPSSVKAVSQRDAVLLYYQHKLNRAPNGSNRRLEAQKQLLNEINNRSLVHNNMKQISNSLFGAENGNVMLHAVRPGGQPLVDDWSCLKTFVSHLNPAKIGFAKVRTYEEHCGALSKYGMKYTRSMANMCNAGITAMQMDMAARRICE